MHDFKTLLAALDINNRYIFPANAQENVAYKCAKCLDVVNLKKTKKLLYFFHKKDICKFYKDPESIDIRKMVLGLLLAYLKKTKELSYELECINCKYIEKVSKRDISKISKRADHIFIRSKEDCLIIEVDNGETSHKIEWINLNPKDLLILFGEREKDTLHFKSTRVWRCQECDKIEQKRLKNIRKKNLIMAEIKNKLMQGFYKSITRNCYTCGKVEVIDIKITGKTEYYFDYKIRTNTGIEKVCDLVCKEGDEIVYIFQYLSRFRPYEYNLSGEWFHIRGKEFKCSRRIQCVACEEQDLIKYKKAEVSKKEKMDQMMNKRNIGIARLEKRRLKSVVFQPITWDIMDGKEDENIKIFIHGINNKGEKIAVLIPDFRPHIYIEVKGSKVSVDSFLDFLKEMIDLLNKIKRGNEWYAWYEPINVTNVKKRKNYYFERGDFLFLEYRKYFHIKMLERVLNNKKFIVQFEKRFNATLVLQEKAVKPLLQFFAKTDIKPSGWIKAYEHAKNCENENDMFSDCDINLVSGFEYIQPIDSNEVINPLILSFDIECVSGDKTGNTFPDPTKDNDQIICISAYLGKNGDDERNWRTYCFVNESNGKECPPVDNCILIHNKNERILIQAWVNFIKDKNPDVIIGYNSLSFDDNYILKRAEKHKIKKESQSDFLMAQIGRLKNYRSSKRELAWNSSAYGDQKFNYIAITGRLHIDMFSFIRREYGNLSSYKLNEVSKEFLNDSKVDLPANEMMNLWYNGTEGDFAKIVEYCNQDTKLPYRLFNKLNTWYGLSEMSNVVMVTKFDVITRGQQWRMFSQVYCSCYKMGIVCCDKLTDYNPTDEEKNFIGATVQNPDVGYHELVPTFDFKSLYPTTIIAYNLCPSTFIKDDVILPENMFNVIEWEDHLMCIHDPDAKNRKTNKKKIICKRHLYRFLKSNVRKGIIPMLLEHLLSARSSTRKKMSELEAEKGENMVEILGILNSRQNGYKTSANSFYGGYGSDVSFIPFYPAAACTTAMGRYSIQKAIDYAKKYRVDTRLIYGDTDSCMLNFNRVSTIGECFEVCKDLEKKINEIFPKPMYLELEKIYSKFFLLTKKRYIGYISDKNNNLLMIDKKGIVLKRRDNCGFLRRVYQNVVTMIMNNEMFCRVCTFLYKSIEELLSGSVPIEELIITKSIRENYKQTNLPHLFVANKMKERGAYVVSGTRVKYIFVNIKGEKPKEKQYEKAEAPDFYLKNMDTLEIDYLYYLKSQFAKPIDELLKIKYHKENCLQNLCSLLNLDINEDLNRYFNPYFKIEILK